MIAVRNRLDSNVKSLEKLIRLQRKVFALICSPIITQAIHQSYAIQFLKDLKRREKLIVKAISSLEPFGGELLTVRDQAENLTSINRPAEFLETGISQEAHNFDDWMSKLLKLQGEVQLTGAIELERKRFMKREKWNTVIQFHKKKRILLRHLKATGKK